MTNENETRWSPLEMSNFDHEVPEGLEADLKAGARSRHSAWDFNGQIWYDPETNLFYEEVWVFHTVAGSRSAATLRDLMSVVNDEFGWD